MKPQELFALQAENERLLKWEQEIMEKAGFLKEQEQRLISLQEQLVSGQAPPPAPPPPPAPEAALENEGMTPSESDLEVKRLRAMNEELRAQLDMAMLGQGGGGGGAQELDALRRQVREVEAARVLERSEHESRLAREQAAHRDCQAAHDLTAQRLLTLTAGHEHATQLLTDLQKKLDAEAKARAAAEEERDRLARQLAVAGGGGGGPAAATPDAAVLAAHLLLLGRELRAQDDAHALLSEEAQAAREAQQALEATLASLKSEHEAELFAKDHEVHKCIQQVHHALAAEASSRVGTLCLAAEVGALETVDSRLQAAEAALGDERARCVQAVAQYEAEAAEGLRSEARLAQAEKAQLAAEERAKRLAERLDQANARRQAAEELAARGEAALARLAAMEGELAEAVAEGRRLRVEVGRLGVEASEREAQHEQALATLREQSKEGQRMRESLLKEAVARAKAAEAEVEELRGQMEAACGGEERAQEGEELALSQVARLERQLAQLRKETGKKDDALQAMARRLEVLAGTATESHMHDMGYWAERGKRTEFATAAYTVGPSKKQASKVARVLLDQSTAGVGGLPGGGPGGGGGNRGKVLLDRSNEDLGMKPLRRRVGGARPKDAAGAPPARAAAEDAAAKPKDTGGGAGGGGGTTLPPI